MERILTMCAAGAAIGALIFSGVSWSRATRELNHQSARLEGLIILFKTELESLDGPEVAVRLTKETLNRVLEPLTAVADKLEAGPQTVGKGAQRYASSGRTCMDADGAAKCDGDRLRCERGELTLIYVGRSYSLRGALINRFECRE